MNVLRLPWLKSRSTIAVLAVAGLVWTLVPGLLRAQLIREFTVPTAESSPLRIAAGPDGALWFTERQAGKIGRISTDGIITEFATPTARSGPLSIAAGPDGALWFTESAASKIGRVTIAGTMTEFDLPNANCSPNGIAVGPDGALWFTELTANKIGRITTTGAVAEFEIRNPQSHPSAIVAGPDSALWFTETQGNKVGRVATTGAITEFELPSKGNYSHGITPGPDGALWFTEGTDRIGRITTTGGITELAILTPRCGSDGITAGPDGSLWFTEPTCGRIGRMTAGRMLSEFELPSAKSRPLGIARGSDGALWFTEARANKIGRIPANAQPEPSHQSQAMPPATPTPTISWGQRRETWEALNEKAVSLWRQGKYSEAAPVAQEALHVAEGGLGREARSSLDLLARIYVADGKAAEAEPLYRKALTMQENTLPANLVTLAAALDDLASVYSSEGKYDAARPLYERSIKLAEKALGPVDIDVASYLSHYAAMLRNANHETAAAQIEARAEAIRASARFKAQSAIRKRDYGAALKILRDQADNGDAFAQSALGDLYLAGRGVPKDTAEALAWHAKAAAQGYAEAEVKLGLSYENGTGVTKDPEEAVRWYRKAAEQGDAVAQRFLGDMYLKGLGVSKDTTEAAKWYGRAAVQAGTKVPTFGNKAPDDEAALGSMIVLARLPKPESMVRAALRLVNLDIQIRRTESVFKQPGRAVTVGTEKVSSENADVVLRRLRREREELTRLTEEYPSTDIGGDYDFRPAEHDVCDASFWGQMNPSAPPPVTVSVVQKGRMVEIGGSGPLAGCGVIFGDTFVLDLHCSGERPERLVGARTDQGIEVAIVKEETASHCSLGTLSKRSIAR